MRDRTIDEMIVLAQGIGLPFTSRQLDLLRETEQPDIGEYLGKTFQPPRPANPGKSSWGLKRRKR